ncbi:cupin domain-containing protein [Thalassobacillus pellis]|uniref:cupin domain-containing protein n=1 Tax=Thalassobacillus pellis TaxID=748008 RepID=UPI0019600860|nr:cupin domain-containing protein [Thalassobacillus pellis]MBM7553718.1 uncharacterized protein YjlB [Thalassobacillus pellis]
MSELEVKTFLFKDDGKIPNHPKLPMLLYPNGLVDNAEECEKIFNKNNWENSWAGNVFGYHHFHSVSHEAIGVISGAATLKMGGENGMEIQVKKGDVAVIPAGVGHKKISASEDFKVVGAYPGGMEYDLKTGQGLEWEEALKNIPQVPLPETDPIQGTDGPLIDIWHKE